VNYQRALEGELERTIRAMSGVEAARVHLAIPPDSIYSGQDRPAKAGVILKLRDRHLSAAMRLAVQRLISSAVDKLDPQSVTVVDAEAGTSSAGAGAQSASEERSAEEQLTDRLLHTLEPVVGADHIRATVHAEFDPSTVEEQQESYDPEKTVALTMQRTEESNGGAQPGGAAGTASNVPGGGAPAKTASSENLALSKSENGTYAVNKMMRHSTQPAGRLKRLAVAVLVDDSYNPADKANPRQKRSSEELARIEDIAKASVGFDLTRGDMLTVRNISFLISPAEPVPLPTRTEKIQTHLKEWSSFIRIAALLLLFCVTYMVILRPVKKQLIRSLNENPQRANKRLSSKPGTDAPALPESDNLIDRVPGAAQHERPKIAGLRNDISTRVKHEPVSAARFIQDWIREAD